MRLMKLLSQISEKFGLEEVKSFLEINNPHNIDIDNDVYKKLSIYPSKPFNS